MLHEVEWTNEKVANFHNNIDELIMQGKKVDNYFSEQVGSELLRIINKKINLKGKTILDYGCGTGSLIQRVLEQYEPETICGCDLSEESIQLCNNKNKKYKRFGGAKIVEKIDCEIEKFDVIFCIEVIEHLNDQELDTLLKSIMRMLKLGGILVMTTPNEEDLRGSMVVCPDCGAYFHRVQHVRSWSEKTLEEYLLQYQIRKKNVILTTIKSRTSFIRKLYSIVYGVGIKILKRKPKNLIYIGEKIS